MELTINDALSKGIEAHKSGNLEEADRYYTAILKVQNDHPDANHNLGVLLVNSKQLEKAISYFSKALESNPNVLQYWLSLIDVFIRLERYQTAKSIIEKAELKGAQGEVFDKLKNQVLSHSTVEVESNEPGDKVSGNILDKMTVDQALSLAKLIEI